MDNPPTGNGVRFPMSLPESSLALANIATLTRKAPNGMSPGEHRARSVSFFSQTQLGFLPLSVLALLSYGRRAVISEV